MSAANSALISLKPDASGPTSSSASRSMTIGPGTPRGARWTWPASGSGDALPGQRPAVDVFESVDLLTRWARLDAFEGPGGARRRGRGGPQHSALVRGAPPQHDEDDEQYHQPDNTGGYRAQHRWRGGARPLVGLLSAGPNALRGLLGLPLGLR
jgi:hypothetical protein